MPSMQFRWNVQPYATLKELRARYTQAMILAWRGAAAPLPEEITTWMRQNAVWKDRSGNARNSLTAALANAAEREFEDQQLIKARAEDAKLLKKLNQDRRAASTTVPIYGKESSRDAEGNLVWNVIGQKSTYVPLSKVPKNLSAVERFKTAFENGKIPVVNIVLYYKNANKEGNGYFLWLEIANNGRYAIIGRALDYWGSKLYNRIKSNANLMQYQYTFDEPLTEEQMFAEHVRGYNEEYYEKGVTREYKPWSPERQEAQRLERKNRRRRARGEYLKRGRKRG